MNVKRCIKCNSEKLLIDFSLDKRRKDGRRGDCKSCVRNYNIKYREINLEHIKTMQKNNYINNKELILTKNKQYRINNKEKLQLKNKQNHVKNPRIKMLYHAKARAKKYKLEFNLIEEDIFIPEKCPVLDIPLLVGETRNTNNSPTIDRIDNSKGYTKDNICVISFRANSIKRDATSEELYKIYEYSLRKTN